MILDKIKSNLNINHIPLNRKKLCNVDDMTDFNGDFDDDDDDDAVDADADRCSKLVTIVSCAFCLCNSVEYRLVVIAAKLPPTL